MQPIINGVVFATIFPVTAMFGYPPGEERPAPEVHGRDKLTAASMRRWAGLINFQTPTLRLNCCQYTRSP